MYQLSSGGLERTVREEERGTQVRECDELKMGTQGLEELRVGMSGRFR